jgi:hypothetical protein
MKKYWGGGEFAPPSYAYAFVVIYHAIFEIEI